MTHPKGTLIRNTAAARINHWITAGCFVLLLLSGLAMFHPMLFFLAALFGGGAPPRVTIAATDSAAVSRAPAAAAGVPLELLRQAQQHYDRAITAQRAGNWAEYGREIEQLGATIRALRAARR